MILPPIQHVKDKRFIVLPTGTRDSAGRAEAIVLSPGDSEYRHYEKISILNEEWDCFDGLITVYP